MRPSDNLANLPETQNYHRPLAKKLLLALHYAVRPGSFPSLMLGNHQLRALISSQFCSKWALSDSTCSQNKLKLILKVTFGHFHLAKSWGALNSDPFVLNVPLTHPTPEQKHLLTIH